MDFNVRIRVHSPKRIIRICATDLTLKNENDSDSDDDIVDVKKKVVTTTVYGKKRNNHNKLTCKKCNKTFKSDKGLEYHIEHKACKECPHSCKFCAKGFTSANSMYRHLRENCQIKKEEEKIDNIIMARVEKKIMLQINQLKQQLKKSKNEKNY